MSAPTDKSQDQTADPAALQAAGTLIAQYGEDAAVIAVMRAAEVAAVGDAQALAHWDRVIAILEAGADLPDGEAGNDGTDPGGNASSTK